MIMSSAPFMRREPKLTGPYKETDPFHEPLVTYAYLAGITKKLELVTGLIILPQRQTALLAKQAADVDLFSDGRLRLGVGVGWNWVEFDGLEMHDHFRRRGGETAPQPRQAADVDLFSAGGLRGGVGVGWNGVNFDALKMHDPSPRR